MPQTASAFAEAVRLEMNGLRSIVEGQQALFPFKIDRERRAWDDAVAWLEARKEAEAEWPWPKREDYDRRVKLGYYHG